MTQDASSPKASGNGWEHTINTHYEGADLRLDFSSECRASLSINGVERDSALSTSDVATLKLGSPVQTGYEHHEFIEASVEYQQSSIIATLITGGETLTQHTIPR